MGNCPSGALLQPFAGWQSVSLDAVAAAHRRFLKLQTGYGYAIDLPTYLQVFETEDEAGFHLWDDDLNGVADAMEMFVGMTLACGDRFQPKLVRLFKFADALDKKELDQTAFVDAALLCVSALWKMSAPHERPPKRDKALADAVSAFHWLTRDQEDLAASTRAARAAAPSAPADAPFARARRAGKAARRGGGGARAVGVTVEVLVARGGAHMQIANFVCRFGTLDANAVLRGMWRSQKHHGRQASEEFAVDLKALAQMAREARKADGGADLDDGDGDGDGDGEGMIRRNSLVVANRLSSKDYQRQQRQQRRRRRRSTLKPTALKLQQEHIERGSAAAAAAASGGGIDAPIKLSSCLYSIEEVKKVKRIFDRMDPHKTGYITAAALAESTKRNPFLSNAAGIFRSVDVDNSGSITFDEILRVFYPYAKEQDYDAMCQAVMKITVTRHHVDALKVMFEDSDHKFGGTAAVGEVLERMRKAGDDYLSMAAQRSFLFESDEEVTFEDMLRELFTRSQPLELEGILAWATPTAVMTDEQRAELKELFAMYDRDAKGYLTRDELIEHLAGIGVRAAEAKRLFSSLDCEETGLVDFTSFAQLFRRFVS